MESSISGIDSSVERFGVENAVVVVVEEYIVDVNMLRVIVVSKEWVCINEKRRGNEGEERGFINATTSSLKLQEEGGNE